MIRIGLLGCLIAAVVALTPASAAPGPVVRTMAGIVQGMESGGVRAFKGIPYAAPPIGALRWQPPQPATRWRGTRAAVEYRPDCATAPGPQPEVRARTEDCLYLNLFAPPAARKGGRHPVMLWIFGSGFQSGSVARPSFDGAALARQGVIVVTVGFRTGIFGYLTLPGLTAASPHHASGNYGVLDAIAALRWVRSNIASFGGDPRRVTIFGQSSGAETVSILTASPLARGLFQRAIQQSGASFGQREAKSLADSEAIGTAFAARLGSADPAALRAMSPEQIFAANPPRFEPVVDGWLLPQDVHAIYAAGPQNHVAMLIGSNADEGQVAPQMTAKAYAERIQAQFGAQGQAFLMHFPATDADAPMAAKRMGTLLLGDYNAATAVALATKTGTLPVYRYRFEHAPPPLSSGGLARGAYHGSEIPYVFANLDAEDRVWTPEDRALSATLSRYWVNFARTGNPNGIGLPIWRTARAMPGRLLRIDSGIAMAPAPNDGDVAFLDTLFYGPGGLFAAQH